MEKYAKEQIDRCWFLQSVTLAEARRGKPV